MNKEMLERIDKLHEEWHGLAERSAQLVDEALNGEETESLRNTLARIAIADRMAHGVEAICTFSEWAHDMFRRQEATKN